MKEARKKPWGAFRGSHSLFPSCQGRDVTPWSRPAGRGGMLITLQGCCPPSRVPYPSLSSHRGSGSFQGAVSASRDLSCLPPVGSAPQERPHIPPPTPTAQDSPLGVPGHSLAQGGDNRPQGRPQDHAVARGAPWGDKAQGWPWGACPSRKSWERQAQPFPAAQGWLFPLPAQHSHVDGAPGAFPWGCPGCGSPGPVSQVTGNWRRGSCSRLESPDSCTHQYGRSPNRNLGRDSSGRDRRTDRDPRAAAGVEGAAGGEEPCSPPRDFQG